MLSMNLSGGTVSVGVNLTEAEKEEVEGYILDRAVWNALPPKVKGMFGNSIEAWKEYVVLYSIEHQLRWRDHLVRSVMPSEKNYFDELMAWSRTHLMLYPYHLSDVMVKGLRITPFKYYLNMMHDVMKEERSYDRLPNFTASDCVRLLGIGRNQYIDTMNTVRGKSWLWRRKRGALFELLPSQPVPIEIAHWWKINIGYVSEDDIRNATKMEHAVIDMLIDVGTRKAGEVDKATVHSLYTKGLIYIDVPVYDEDYIIIPPLEGFVMNRVIGDYFENLLYKLFVSVDERTNVEQLAHILQMDVQMIKQALSLYLRLGFAKKKNFEELAQPTLDDGSGKLKTRWHPSWLAMAGPTSPGVKRPAKEVTLTFTQKDGEGSASYYPSFFSEPTASSEDISTVVATPLSKPDSVPTVEHSKRIAFLFDSTITAYLMMGNLGAGLKTHAVTMFERGKLSDEFLDSLLEELQLVKPKAEGEAQRYVDHAICLKNTIQALRYNKKVLDLPDCDGGIDLIRCERINTLDEATRLRLLEKNYAVLISMAPISTETEEMTRVVPRHFGPPLPEFNSMWWKLFVYNEIGAGPPTILYPRGARVTQLPTAILPYDRVTFTAGLHEPAVLPTANLLPVLNEALTSSSVWIQAFAYAHKSTVVHVPFPVRPPPEGYIVTEYDQDNLEYHPFVQQLQEKLNLQYGFGYITMSSPHALNLPVARRLSGEGEPVEDDEDEDEDEDDGYGDTGLGSRKSAVLEHKRTPESDEWTVVEVTFGMPLFDPQLNKAVCERIESFRLFSEDNLAQYTKHSQYLSNALLDFIEAHQAPHYKYEVEPGQVPPPTKTLTFAGNAAFHHPHKS